MSMSLEFTGNKAGGSKIKKILWFSFEVIWIERIRNEWILDVRLDVTY